MAVENGDVRVLAGLERSGELVHSHDDRRIEGDRFESLELAQPPEAEGLGRVQEEVAHPFRIVGIEGYQDAPLGHQGRRMGHRVEGLPFISPKIGESRNGHVVFDELVGDSVALQAVLEGRQLHPVLPAEADDRGHFRALVGVAADPQLAPEDVGHRLQAIVLPRRQGDGRALSAPGLLDLLFVGFPGFHVVAGLVEFQPDGFLHAHAGAGIAGFARARKVRLLGVFAQGPLARQGRALEQEALGVRSPPQLQADASAADGIGRAVGRMNRGHAAR